MAWTVDHRTFEKFCFDVAFSVLPVNGAIKAFWKQFGYSKIFFFFWKREITILLTNTFFFANIDLPVAPCVYSTAPLRECKGYLQENRSREQKSADQMASKRKELQ